MVKNAWQYVIEHLPPEWLILNPAEKSDLQKILS
jgi:hypothetical protein